MIEKAQFEDRIKTLEENMATDEVERLGHGRELLVIECG